jgi:thiamine kinase-like enzyme
MARMPPDAASPTIEAVVAAIPAWQGREVRTEPISGGLTNRNYRVEVDGAPFFVRIPGPATELLAIDRANELFNTRAAAQAGVGPKVIEALPGWDVIVLEWLPARTMSVDAFGAPASPDRIGAVLRRLHAGPPFKLDFDMFRLTERYLAVVDERALPIPAGYREALPAVARIETALAQRPLAPVPCHNDLLAENYLDDGRRLWIVDYEYSGNNDPTFELGNTCQELGFDDDRAALLCAAYFGPTEFAASGPELLARMHLQMIMSDIGWTLWAAIQARVSTIDYDFWGWAEERWARAAGNLARPAFGEWLAAVR